MVDLDNLLFDPPTEDMALVADALEAGYDEHWSVALIRRYLLSDDQRQHLTAQNADISDLLNGRIENFTEYSAFVDAWNARLGRRVFGF